MCGTLYRITIWNGCVCAASVALLLSGLLSRPRSCVVCQCVISLADGLLLVWIGIFLAFTHWFVVTQIIAVLCNNAAMVLVVLMFQQHVWCVCPACILLMLIRFAISTLPFSGWMSAWYHCLAWWYDGIFGCWAAHVVNVATSEQMPQRYALFSLVACIVFSEVLVLQQVTTYTILLANSHRPTQFTVKSIAAQSYLLLCYYIGAWSVIWGMFISYLRLQANLIQHLTCMHVQIDTKWWQLLCFEKLEAFCSALLCHQQ